MRFFFFLMASFGFLACHPPREFDQLEPNCETALSANVSYAEVHALYQDGLLQIQNDWIIEGYVNSSDRSGNFFSILHFQDTPENPTMGFQIEIDLRDSYLQYPRGSKIYIKLKGLFLGKRNGVFTLGGTFEAFGTTSVGRLPALQLQDHIVLDCGAPVELRAVPVSIGGLDMGLTNTLVTFSQLEFELDALGQPIALEFESTERVLIDCLDDRLGMVNSGFSDFHQTPVPEGSGSITGVLLRDGDDLQLAIRDLEDIRFGEDRCAELITEYTSTELFFSELADPDNDADARFIELYNAADTPLDLNGWSIRRYTNANLEVGSTTDLSGLTIAAKGSLVISPNAVVFEQVYGFSPDLGVGSNSPADSNGNDNLELVDPFGSVIDTFGVIGEDGSGTDHEFEDGKAVRKPEVIRGNPVYDFSEWTVFNDTGGAMTIDQPQNAPEDFTPGRRD
ncbi:MAG: lamin tail domain-containing protein [Flavobacteriaceae bacterium]|nr:lamin tail domain-containing protein [Flavobacteriaceae bacterium]